MRKNIRVSGYQVIRLLIVAFLHWSLVIGHWSFALQNVPSFRGDEVVVTGTRQPQRVAKSPWNTSVVPNYQLANFKTVGDALRLVVGVDEISYGGSGALNSVRLRGANASQVLILVDGRRINSPTLGMVDVGDILTANVERIEVVRSPLSALYGSDAVSGVINIITKAPSKMIAELEVVGGSFADQEYRLSYGGSNGIINIKSVKTDGFRQNSGYSATDVGGKLNYPFFLGNLQLDVAYYDSLKGIPGVPTLEVDPYSASQPNDNQRDRNIRLCADLKNKDYDLKVFQNLSNEKINSFNWGTSTIETWQTGVEFQQKLGDFLYGLEYREDRGITSGIGDRSINNIAAFIQDDVALFSNLLMSVGIRGDRHSIAGKSINPRIGFAFQPTDEVTVRATCGTAFRAPTLNELYYYNYSSFYNYTYTGDTALKPEQAFSYELGVERRFAANTAARVNYFVTNTTDLILWDSQSSTIETRAKNVGEAYQEGVEFEIVRQLGGTGRAFANFIYQQALDKKDVNPLAVGKTLPYTPKTKFNAGLVLGDSTVMIRNVGERSNYDYLYNPITLPAYTVVDLKYAQKFGEIELILAANNVFNQQYSEVIGTYYDPVTYIGENRNYPMPGRNYSFGIKWVL
jgi:outer membrane cobalamin receptor